MTGQIMLGPMPAIGFGTWPLKGEQCRDAVLSAIDVGYRLIDTAQAYGNEAEVGAALRAAGARDRIFLTTKLWPDRLAPDDVSQAVDESLSRLQTDHVDLLLVHWPNPAIPLAETLAAMDAVRRSSRAKRIGISNFTTKLIAEAKSTGVELFCNQVEFHPFLDQRKVLAATREAGLHLVGYSPLARGKGGGQDVLQEIGNRYGKNWSQVILRWALQHDGVGVVVKASTRARQAENLAIFDFALNEAEMEAVTGLANNTRVVDMAIAPAWD
jgi:2,5-diketo-D-gluconate reductase B